MARSHNTHSCPMCWEAESLSRNWLWLFRNSTSPFPYWAALAMKLSPKSALYHLQQPRELCSTPQHKFPHVAAPSWGFGPRWLRNKYIKNICEIILAFDTEFQGELNLTMKVTLVNIYGLPLRCYPRS